MCVLAPRRGRRINPRVPILLAVVIIIGIYWTDSISIFTSFHKDKVNGSPNLFMGEKQCRRAFSQLMKEIDGSVERLDGKKLELKKQNEDIKGMVEGRVKDGKLFVISAEYHPNRDMLFERQAVLHALHRALITSPPSEPLPDTVFTFSILDSPRTDVWSFARNNEPQQMRKGNWWVMPHFGHWSWPKRFIGTLDEVRRKVEVVEREINGWDGKLAKAIWRGTVWFNGVGNNQLRPKLLEATKDKPWADVQNMKWVTNAVDAKNAINIEDFCKYKYIIYTEGVTYSGRLPYHLLCNSVIITPPLQFNMHTTHLLRPLISASLPFSPSFTSNTPPGTNPRWPTAYSAEKANIVFVEPDWRDLEQTIQYLEAHQDVAKGIAANQRRTFGGNGGGVLGEAAEVCYWRQLLRSWASVVTPKNGTVQAGDRYPDERIWAEGVRWETFSLVSQTRWPRA
ncbi:glycosyl transferase family 90-domain-containing protein [Amylocarpus encephaloides]|uniref:Glycosyl transferase family 90-domain-containing protein n=1 Tax=Amylocarpus encephaloides TaxID=45428 RepID=A0A9P8C9A9_9HELO|nr:glycosyl transferase family 90-domain-containing protein [Amylocarpus encephaloides]